MILLVPHRRSEVPQEVNRDLAVAGHLFFLFGEQRDPVLDVLAPGCDEEFEDRFRSFAMRGQYQATVARRALRGDA